MVDKSSLRSNKPDPSTSSNGDVPLPKSNSKSISQGKAAPTRTTSSRGKAPTAKKGSANNTGAKDTDEEESPRTNGVDRDDSIENKVNGIAAADVDMANDPPDPVEKTGDEEMTVVVPPSKGSRLSGEPGDAGQDDVVMEDGEDAQADSGEAKVDPVAQTVVDIKANFPLLERAVAHFDARFSLRVLRSIPTIRKRLSPEILAQVITEVYPPSNQIAKTLLAAIHKEHELDDSHPTEMDVDSETRPQSGQSKATSSKEVLPEIEIYLSILVQVYLFDTEDHQAGATVSSSIVQRIHALNRRTLDPLSARVYFYYSLFYERLPPYPPSPLSPVISIRQQLLAALRTSVLRKDPDTQAVATTLLLRNYLSTSHISQADLLVSHTQFPETAPDNQFARFLYYLGRIRAIQLSYTEAHERLTGATRKSSSSASAAGFYQASTKLLIVVELLMGDIPDRAIFRQQRLERALKPYFLLVQAVRVGDLEAFSNAVSMYNSTFRQDGTYTLILRLRQNVIRTGIRMMSLSYSRISLRDICVRLGLGSEESAEYIVAKAIRDGVIEASLDHERGFMKSKDVGDVYATREPGEAFHDRIRACLALHDESVKAMKFPMNPHRLELKNAQEARERERELAKEIQDGDIDEDDAGGEFEGM